MLSGRYHRGPFVLLPLLTVLLSCSHLTFAGGEFGPVEMVLSDGNQIDVTGYSIPSFVDWDDDGLKDLIVGEGSGSYTPKVRIYKNVGSAASPSFSGYFLAQAAGADLTAVGSGCMGLFPRVSYWDSDLDKDLIVGQSNGTVKFFKNVGSDAAPTFDGGTLLEVGPPGAEVPIDVGSRSCVNIVDWDGDGIRDLVVGALDGRIHLFINEGTDTAPQYLAETFAMDGGVQLVVPSGRASPVVMDYDGDGMNDLLTGNTNGELLLYLNVAAAVDDEPVFAGYTRMDSDGAAIDLAASRSRPFILDWTGDGMADALIGASDGRVYLYQGVPEPTAMLIVAAGACVSLFRRRT